MERSSPWMAPAIFVPKKSGDLRLCVDYRELHKKAEKMPTHCPLPLPDEVQALLSGSTVLSTLDLQSGYWQLLVRPTDQEKTAFCPGPGMGLYEFRRMPFGYPKSLTVPWPCILLPPIHLPVFRYCSPP